MRMIAVPSLGAQRAHQLEDLRLDGDVERGGGLVGDQEPRVAGERHRDHHALAHAARELVRIVVEARRSGDGMRTRRSISIACALRFLLADTSDGAAAPRRSGRRP